MHTGQLTAAIAIAAVPGEAVLLSGMDAEKPSRGADPAHAASEPRPPSPPTTPINKSTTTTTLIPTIDSAIKHLFGSADTFLGAADPIP